MNYQTVFHWTIKHENDAKDYFERKSGSGRPIGLLSVPTKDQRSFIIDMIDENTDSLILDDMMNQ
ncbi:hypothetical protein BDF14DRAFT_1910194, partial [Spinellus fusiger]